MPVTCAEPASPGRCMCPLQGGWRSDTKCAKPGGVSSQRGVTLLFALLTLVALMLSTLALVRMVDGGTLVLGNIGFKQDATAAAEQATRQAEAWLAANHAALNTDVPVNGYYASTQEYDAGATTPSRPPIDATGGQLAGTAQRQLIDWDRDGCAAAGGTYQGCTVQPADANGVNGNSARYVILRLCSQPGDAAQDPRIVCAKPVARQNGGALKKGQLNYTEPAPFAGSAGPYYRILVRVKGARNTTSFTESVIHF